MKKKKQTRWSKWSKKDQKLFLEGLAKSDEIKITEINIFKEE